MTKKPDTNKASQAGAETGTKPADKKANSKPAPAKKRAGRTGFIVWSLAALALIGGALTVTWPAWKTPALEYVKANAPGLAAVLTTPFAPPLPVEPPAPTAETPAASPTGPLRARLDALERALADTANDVAGLSGGNGSGNVTALEDINKKLSGLAARLQEVETKLAASDGATGIRLLLLGQVQSALGAGQSFSDSLNALKRLMAKDADGLALLARLGVHGISGVATSRRLIDDFEITARAVAQAIRRDAFTETVGDGAGASGWLAGLWGKLTSLVVVRRVGPGAAEDTSADALLARASHALDGGDLAGALIALQGLGHDAAMAAAPWVAQAQARLDADKAFAALRAHILAASGG